MILAKLYVVGLDCGNGYIYYLKENSVFVQDIRVAKMVFSKNAAEDFKTLSILKRSKEKRLTVELEIFEINVQKLDLITESKNQRIITV